MQLFKTILYNLLTNSGYWNFSKTKDLVNNYFYELHFRDSSNFTLNYNLKKDFYITENPKVVSNSFNIELPNNYYCSNATELIMASGCELDVSIDYYPFGMPMPGRSFSSNQYRYGFNGMEKDDEIKNIEGSSYDFGARLYDPRLGKWLALDPLMKKYPGITPYAFVANSPIYWLDKEGKDLWIGGDREKAMSDVKSVVPKKYHSRITVSDDGQIAFDVKGLSESEIANDAGLTLVKDMVGSDNKYLYEVSDNNDGKPLRSSNSTVENNSKTPHMEHNKKGNKLPEGVDGQVIIHPDAENTDDVNGEETPMSRAGFVFHELQENYERTDNKKPYAYMVKGVEDKTKDGAHTTASKKAANLHSKAKKPSGSSRKEGDYKNAKIIK